MQYKQLKQLTALYKRVASQSINIGAMLSLKRGRPMIDWLLRASRVIGCRLNNSIVKVIFCYTVFLNTLWRRGGLPFVVIYLKAATSILQQAIGGQRLSDMSPLKLRFKRTGGGLPRVIPVLHRAQIRKGSVWHIKLWMTLFGLYRLIEIPGKLNLTTITDPPAYDVAMLHPFSVFVSEHLWPLVRRCFPVEGSVTDALWPEEKDSGAAGFTKYNLRATPFLISKASPSVAAGNAPATPVSTSPAGIVSSAYTWSRHPLYQTLQSWCELTRNQWVIEMISSMTKVSMDPLDGGRGAPGGPDTPAEGRERLGRLGFKVEPAGKVRVFAMVDPWTQWLLKPLHEAIFNLLRVIPQDGTFDQLKPITRLLESYKGPLYSFDLSSATDRLPLVFQKILLSPIITSWGAELWGALLTSRSYSHGKIAKKDYGVDLPAADLYYATGQPMGALSSWAMLALTHHAIVQWAAHLAGVCPKAWFQHYAILGDDVVIGNKDVARWYREIMSGLDVKIGDHKSLISLRGTAIEFAKRTFLNGEDVSMLPLKEFFASVNSLTAYTEFVRKYNFSLGTAFAVLGYGYKTLSRIGSRLSLLPLRARNYIVTLTSPNAPFFKDLKSWLAMKSISSTFRSADERLEKLGPILFVREKEALLSRLANLLPLIKEAEALCNVDKAPKPSSAAGLVEDPYNIALTRPGDYILYDFLGLSTDYTGVSPETQDLLRQKVYMPSFRESVLDYRTAVRNITNLEMEQASWEVLEEFWTLVDRTASDLGSLPLPRNIYTATHAESRISIGVTPRRWLYYNSVFRKTV